MRIVFVAAECEPLAKVGGLGDVVDALARALGRLPDAVAVAPVEVFLPRYRGLPAGPLTRRVRVPDPLAAAGTTEVGIVDLEADGYRIRLVDHPPAFDRDGIYGDPGGDYPDSAWRFGLFGRAVLETLRGEGRPVDVIHAHDWHACPVLLELDRRYAADPILGAAATALTIHNPSYHGLVAPGDVGQLGLVAGEDPRDPARGVDLLRSGATRADVVNTVSPGFAAEIVVPGHGFGLEGTLRARGERFLGILNGLDTELWDPATDPVLPARYSAADTSGKIACRTHLLARLGFDPGDQGPVLGMIGRLDPQKGFDILAAATPGLLGLGARVVALGSGAPELAAEVRAAAAARPDRVVLIEDFDRDLARWIYAGVDLLLMPSRFEPCGLSQLIALRYGTPPIVHATGGLRDTVVDEHDAPGRGTGWVFRHPTPDGLVWAAGQAMSAYRDAGPAWRGVVSRGMAADFDWTREAAPRYLAMYRQAIAVRRTAVTSAADA
jgi:starch synthase